MEKTKVHKIHRRKERKYFKKQIESKKVHRKKKEVKNDRQNMCEEGLSCLLDFKRNKKKKKKTNKLKKNPRYIAAITSHMTCIFIQRKHVLMSGNMTLSPKALSAGKYCCQKDNCI